MQRQRRQSDQGAVWADIQQKAAGSLEEYLRACRWVEGQAGVTFGMGGQMVGLDLFDYPFTMQRLFPKLPRSHALDALDGAAVAGEIAMNGLLSELAVAPVFGWPAVGLGKDLRIQGRALLGQRCGWRRGTFTWRRSGCVVRTRASRPG